MFKPALVLLSLGDAKDKIETWRRDYNEVLSTQVALDWRTPHEFALQAGLEASLQGNPVAGKSTF